jgi:hypothetical protein
MKHILWATILLLLTPLASAETYRISGKATYADNSAVALGYVYVNCEQGEFECYQYRGTEAMTNAYGEFTVVIDADSEEDGIEILLTLKGENFTHVIDINQHQNSPEGKVYQNLKLQQNPTASGVMMGFGCFIVLFVVAFVSVLLRTGSRLSTERGRLEFMGYREAKRLECPKCKEMVYQHELVKHLIVDHDLDPLDAGEITGMVMRRTWSEEE